MNHKSLVEWHTAAMGAHDCHHWQAWRHLPFELWPDAALVSYLAGPDSDYMTGQSIIIDGGMVYS